MSASHDAYGEALSVACRFVRRHPKLAHLARTQDDAGAALIADFQAERAVRRYMQGQAYRRESEFVIELLDKADDYVNYGGQAQRVFALYAEQLGSGQLDSALSTRRAVHRAVFSLAAHQGAPLLASLREIGTVVQTQSEVTVTHAAIAKHVSKLSRDGMFRYTPGTPGLRQKSGLFAFDLTAEPDLGLDHEAVSALVLGSDVILAVHDFRDQAQRDLSRRSGEARRPHSAKREEQLAQAQEIKLGEAEMDRLLWAAALPTLAAEFAKILGNES